MSIWRFLMGWIQSLEFVTQSAHMGWGGFVTMLLSLWIPWYCAAATFLLVWVGPKELVLDAASWGENHGSPDWDDAAFYALGTAVACLVLYLKG